MAKDPVCGMEVEEQKAAGTSQLGGDTTGLMMIRNVTSKTRGGIMKHYRLRVLILSTGIVALSSGFLPAQQTWGQEKPAEKGEMKSMGDMSMGGDDEAMP